ncbi:MAG: 4-hydroxyphenylacetate 3-hydroxylase N-terminal domain-containing protein [Candidatus Eisenbacteria bacterium]
MPLRTPDDFVASMKARKPMDVWFRGEKIKDVLTHPALKPSLETIKRIYELAGHPKFKELLTTKSHLTGEVCNFYTAPLMSRDDAIQKTKLARALGEILGCCTFRCTGSEAISGLYPTTFEMDKALGTDYHERLKKWLLNVQKKDLTVTAALTDPKGDRRLKPQDQKDPDFYTRIIEKRDDGIVIRGSKVNQTGIIFADEFVVLPTTTLTEDGKQYAVCCAIPTDTEGLSYVLGRTPVDRRLEDGKAEEIDVGKKYGDHQAMLIMEDVFVASERVFMCEEWQFTPKLMEYFTAVHRLTAGACKSGGVSLLLGATKLAADAINISKIGHVRSKLAEMGISAETLYALSLSAGFDGFQHESGAWIPNPLLAHTTKYQATILPFNAIRYARELMSGIGETAPSAKDYLNSEIGPKIQKYLAPAKEGMTAEDRLRIIRLIENLTRGTNWTAMALHGGGNTEAARLMALRHIDFDKLAKIAEVACGIEKDESKAADLISEREGKIDHGPDVFK